MKYELSLNWKNKRIMVVDDEEFCIDALRIMFKRMGVDVDR